MGYNKGMRFEVPQFIEIEDKIFGPFTWKQFIYLAGGAGAAVTLYLFLPFFFFVLLGLPVMGLACFLAFHQINNRPFSIFLESAVRYFTTRKLYLWKKKEPQVIHGEAREASAYGSMPLKTGGGISSLSHKLELNTIDTPHT